MPDTCFVHCSPPRSGNFSASCLALLVSLGFGCWKSVVLLKQGLVFSLQMGL